VECLVEYKERGLKAQMSRANKLGADWVLIIGEEEVKKARYQLKNMASAEQKEVTQEEMLEILRESF
jgi:histidyl-tRNA synthetase